MGSEDARKLFVAGLPDSVTEEVLRGLFVESGADVTELTLPRDRMSGRPRGFAFVRLGSPEDAERARQVLDGRIMDGKVISVRPFQAEPPPRSERPSGGGPGGDRGDRGGPGFGGAPDRTLYVGNLPYDTTQEEIQTFLQECGAEPVLRVHLPLDLEGRKRGFGFVTLGSAEVAKAAVERLKGAELRGRRLVVNLAHPKADPRPRTDGPVIPSERPPRSFAGSFVPPAPPAGFGPPLPPGGKPDARRKRKFEGEGAEGRGRATRRDQEERWRDTDDDE